MELFSKRNLYSAKNEDHALLPTGLRNRLQEEIKYIITSGKYVEDFLIVEDKGNDKIYLHNQTLKNISLREMGYDMTEIVKTYDLSFDKSEYRDVKFLDLIELLIIFCKLKLRAELVTRLIKIFDEEKSKFSINDSIVFNREEEGLRNIAPLIQESTLQKKLREYYNSLRLLRPDHEHLAKISADVIQAIFSSPQTQSANKSYSENLCRMVAKKWTSTANIEALTSLLSETVRNAKALNNQISNVRHTDKSSIQVATPNLYKLITAKNIKIAELFILSTPNLYIKKQDPEKIKNEYLKKYSLDKEKGWIVASTLVEDLPF